MTVILALEKLFCDEKRTVLSALQSGTIIAYPTDTIYGLGVDAYNAKAVCNLLELKGRPPGKPISVLYAAVEAVFRDFQHLNDFQQKVVRKLLPGQITLVLPTAPNNHFPREITSDNTLGVRVIDLEALNCILSQFPHPITTTSVNPAGQPPARSVAEILSYFGDQISLILARDRTTDSVPSTLVKVGGNSLQIMRPGAMSITEIEEKMNQL